MRCPTSYLLLCRTADYIAIFEVLVSRKGHHLSEFCPFWKVFHSSGDWLRITESFTVNCSLSTGRSTGWSSNVIFLHDKVWDWCNCCILYFQQFTGFYFYGVRCKSNFLALLIDLFCCKLWSHKTLNHCKAVFRCHRSSEGHLQNAALNL